MVVSQLLAINIVALTVAALIGAGTCFYIVSRTRRLFNFRLLLVVNAILIGPISGMVHLWRFSGASRGYYDVTVSPGLGVATLGTIVGMIVICFGSAKTIAPATEVILPTNLVFRANDRAILGVCAVALLPLSVYAIIRVRTYAQDSGLVRLISVDQGLARYSFISNWFVWVVSFTALLLVTKFVPGAPILGSLITLGAVAAIIASLSWTGGRSIILVMVLPLLSVVGPQLKRMRGLMAGAVVVLLGVLELSVTQIRTSNSSAAAYLSAPTWFDWQWGRYSMLGFASDYTVHHGLLYGQTFLASASDLILGIGKLFGATLPSTRLTEVTEITGGQLAGNSHANYIVPGIESELYLNFGMLGIVFGLYVLARATAWADLKFTSTTRAIPKFAWAYIGTLLVFRTLPSDSGALYSYVLYLGLPVIVVAAISKFAWRGPSRSRADAERGVLLPRGEFPRSNVGPVTRK